MQPINYYLDYSSDSQTIPEKGQCICFFLNKPKQRGMEMIGKETMGKGCRVALLLILLANFKLFAQDPASFTIATNGKTTPIYIDKNDFPGVIRAATDLQSDIQRVTTVTPVLHYASENEKEIIIIGTIGNSETIDQLIQTKKINVEDVKGKWESYLIEVIQNPLPNVDRALVIAGSDKRGTIYGIYEISKQIGVSPWYWWADVPVVKQSTLEIPSIRITDSPTVQYRGIFINDEAPALAGWATEKFGGFNHQFYANVYELILRLKGNFLWPAMWGRAIYDDDPLSAPLADEYGVVIGTSHHEPMMRAHVEWDRYGKGEWNYETNERFLKDFWKKGIDRMGNNESIITLAMRGDGDMAMSKETNVELLERIVHDQREIINASAGKAKDFPQVWALYKEVQDYYDQGMRVPDDVTLLLCDDNWGNLRKLPKLSDAPRKGGYGIYYHFDYVGGPRNYKWLNTTQVSRVWEQMNLAYQYGVEKIWIVNVGDIKPMELPISFFLDMAWDPKKWNEDNLTNYTTQWAATQFGNEHAEKIASMLTRYTNYNARRKPELLSPETYSLTHYREFENVVAEYNQLAEEAKKLYDLIGAEYKDAFYQLVLFPIQACANLNDLYYSTALNRLYANQERAATNEMASRVQLLFEKDKSLTHYHNNILADGKWSHMMDQTHIGYTYWQQPPTNVIPETKQLKIPKEASIGAAVEGSANWWPNEKAKATLPGFDCFSKQQHYIEIFNQGETPLRYTIKSGKPWVLISPQSKTINQQERLEVQIDWKKVPHGKHTVPITIKSKGQQTVVVFAIVDNRSDQNPEGFVESNGYVSIEAAHFTKAINSDEVQWKVIPEIGKTLSGVSPFPVTAAPQTLKETSPHLEYDIYVFQPGEIKIDSYLSPTLNFHNEGLRFAVSIDDEEPQPINMHEGYSDKLWNQWVADNIIIKTSSHTLSAPGKHTVKFWMVDPGIVLQKIVVGTNAPQQSYMAPPESPFIKPTLSNKK